MLHIAWNVSLTIETTFWKEMEITQLYNYTACMYIYYPLSTTTVHIYIYIDHHHRHHTVQVTILRPTTTTTTATTSTTTAPVTMHAFSICTTALGKNRPPVQVTVGLVEHQHPSDQRMCQGVHAHSGGR